MYPLVAWIALASLGQEPAIRLADCPAAVQRTIRAEAAGARIEALTREKAGEEPAVYRLILDVGGRKYAASILEDGTLAAIRLGVEAELPLEQCPPPVRETFRREAFGEPVDVVDRGMKSGIVTYRAIVVHDGKSYALAVAEDGCLLEKTLTDDDQEVELAKCPAAVRTAFRRHAGGTTVVEIVRHSILGRQTFGGGAQIQGKNYVIEVAADGHLIAKTLAED